MRWVKLNRHMGCRKGVVNMTKQEEEEVAAAEAVADAAYKAAVAASN